MGNLYILNGPAMGRNFNLRDGVNFLGRSLDNDIRIDDKTVSRNHLKIVQRSNRYFIADLKSRNGTFIYGKYISPGAEVEVKEGVPIAVGITVICLGEVCQDQMMPFLESGDITQEEDEFNRTLKLQRDRVIQKKLEFLYNVSNVLTEDLSIEEALERVLDYILDLLKRIDRGVFVLINPETEEITKTIYKSNKFDEDATTAYCRDVVSRVIKSKRPYVVSDAKTDAGEFSDTLELLKIESVMCVPLTSRSEVLGAIYVDSLERPYGFRREDLALLMNLSQRIAPVIDQARFASDILEVVDSLSNDS